MPVAQMDGFHSLALSKKKNPSTAKRTREYFSLRATEGVFLLQKASLEVYTQ